MFLDLYCNCVCLWCKGSLNKIKLSEVWTEFRCMTKPYIESCLFFLKWFSSLEVIFVSKKFTFPLNKQDVDYFEI